MYWCTVPACNRASRCRAPTRMRLLRAASAQSSPRHIGDNDLDTRMGRVELVDECHVRAVVTAVRPDQKVTVTARHYALACADATPSAMTTMREAASSALRTTHFLRLLARILR